MTPPNPAAKLWLFDFDNTLAALEREVDWPGSRRELEAWLRAQGVSDAVFAEIPKGNLPLYNLLHSRWLRAQSAECDAALPSAAAEALLRHASGIIERHELIGAARAAPTAGAIELLEAIARRGAIAMVVTSNSSRTVAEWLARHGVDGRVHAIVGRNGLLALKPSPEMVQRAISMSGMTAAEAVFVGDSPADYAAAGAAGVGFYGVGGSDAARDRLLAAGAVEVFASPGALGVHLGLLTQADFTCSG